jgi:pimeloyl-ACP methyl ester carboxylesterase
MGRLKVRGVLLCAIAALGGACGSSTPTTPTPPALVTDTFTGTLTQNGGITHQFTISVAGTVTATLTTLGPDSTKAVGFSMGTLIGTVCQAVLADDAAVQSRALQGNGTPGGTFCVRIYDVGSITADTGPFTYTITVTHP